MCEVADGLIRVKRTIKRFGVGGLLAVYLTAACASVRANGPARQANAAGGRQKTETNAARTLRRSLEFYRALRAFSMDYQLEVHVTKGDFSGGTAECLCVAMQRPNRLAIRLHAGANPVLVLCDGSRVFRYMEALNRFESTPAPASVADIEATGIHNHSQPERLDPLEFIRPLFDCGRTGMLADAAPIAQWAGTETVDGFPCSHIRFDGKGCAWQLWVEDGPRPIVHKLECDISVSEIKALKTAPEIAGATIDVVAHYRNWSLSPVWPPDTFKFTPPADIDLTGPSDFATDLVR